MEASGIVWFLFRVGSDPFSVNNFYPLDGGGNKISFVVFEPYDFAVLARLALHKPHSVVSIELDSPPHLPLSLRVAVARHPCWFAPLSSGAFDAELQQAGVARYTVLALADSAPDRWWTDRLPADLRWAPPPVGAAVQYAMEKLGVLECGSMVGTPPGLLDNPQAGAGADLPLRADNAFVLDLTRAGAGGPRKRKRRAMTRRPTAPTDGVYEIRAVLGERQNGDAREVRLQWQDGELPDEWVPFTDLLPDTREWAEAELRYQRRHSFGPSDRAAAPSGDELSSWAGARVLVDLAREQADEEHSESDEADAMSGEEEDGPNPAPSSKGGQDSVDSVVPWISVAEARDMTLPADGEYAPRDGAPPPVLGRWFFATVRRN